MSSDYTPDRIAEGRIQLAIARLAADYPFHAAVLGRFRVMPHPSIGTMGVTVEGGSVRLYHRPEFVRSLTMDELEGVLLHEVHHVVLGHPWADPDDYPDKWARVVSEETTTNEFIRLPLPGNPITLAQFPNLPPLESTKQRYDRLARTRHRCTRACPTVDDHSHWDLAQKDPRGSRRAALELIREAVRDVGRDKVPEYLRPAIAGAGIGRDPGTGRYELQGLGRGRVDWRQELRRYTGRMLEVRPVFNRPPRRFPELVGLLPGRRRQPARPRVMAVVDTSGSMSGDLLEQVNAELVRLARRASVLVVECDAAIRSVYPYRKLTTLCGRGGTDFRPPLSPDFLQKHKPDVILVFSDGYGPAPTNQPRVPLVWCLFAGGQRPAPWGRVIEMDQPG
jgi:predicted metal-dependent peptidase